MRLYCSLDKDSGYFDREFFYFIVKALKEQENVLIEFEIDISCSGRTAGEICLIVGGVVSASKVGGGKVFSVVNFVI